MQRRTTLAPCGVALSAQLDDSDWQRSGDFLGAVALDDVADLDVVEVLDGDTALVALLHFADVVLEAAERADGAVVHLDAVANDPDASPDE